MAGFSGGLSSAIAIVVAAVLLTPSSGPATHPHTEEATAAPNTAAPGEDTASLVGVDAVHTGDLTVHVEAQVTTPTFEALVRATVVAYADMTAMPMAHRQGPIVLVEAPGRPGIYEGSIEVPMVGDYAVTVDVERPLAGSGVSMVPVGTVAAPD